jgi:hypothetical protein
MGALLTNYVYFTVAMYGFFSVGMVSDAKVFYGSESPLCYFTEFDVSGQWFAKMVGTIIFFLVMSPFYAGVSFETYARISLPMNLIQTPVFIKAAFLDTNTGPDGCNSPYAMPFSLWIPQVGLCFVLIVWNVMALNQDYSGAQGRRHALHLGAGCGVRSLLWLHPHDRTQVVLGARLPLCLLGGQ